MKLFDCISYPVYLPAFSRSFTGSRVTVQLYTPLYTLYNCTSPCTSLYTCQVFEARHCQLHSVSLELSGLEDLWSWNIENICEKIELTVYLCNHIEDSVSQRYPRSERTWTMNISPSVELKWISRTKQSKLDGQLFRERRDCCLSLEGDLRRVRGWPGVTSTSANQRPVLWQLTNQRPDTNNEARYKP